MHRHRVEIRTRIQKGLLITLKRPKLGFSFPARTLRAVDLPMPFVPTKPRTCPGLGTGSLQMHHFFLFFFSLEKHFIKQVKKAASQPVQLKGIGAITMGGVFIQILRQVNDLNCFKWAFLHQKINNPLISKLSIDTTSDKISKTTTVIIEFQKRTV
jgi:hypothetical protein